MKEEKDEDSNQQRRRRIYFHGFLGGNIKVKDFANDNISLENELRDTEGDWFYWAFCVTGAKGKTFMFDFG